MSNKHINQICILLLGLCNILTGCKEEIPFEPYLNLIPTTIIGIESYGTNYSLTINSNVSWVANSQADWITISPTSSDGNTNVETVTVSISSNKLKEGREGIIIFRNMEYNLTDTVFVSQKHDKEAIEREVLIAFYKATDGDNWNANYGWCSDLPISHWSGVGLDSEGKVKTLSLCNRGLSGSIPSEITNLSHLTRLDLEGNNISGSIPVELGNLTKLKYLNLDHNQIYGSIPAELGNLTKLEYLNLDHNQISGSIPAELGNITNLFHLNLSNNQISGSIPAELGNITNLFHLNLSNNQISGSIPAELGNITNLVYLILSNNQISGSIPAELGNLTKLEYLHLINNQITGSIPEFIGNLKSYSNVFLVFNFFEGKVPTKITEHKDWHNYWPQLVYKTKVNLYNTKINAPEFTVTDMDGNTITSDELYKKNKITILYKWGKWCGYSLAYNQTLKGLLDKYASQGLEILGAHILYDDNSEQEKQETKEYINKYIPWNNFICSSGNHIKLLHFTSSVPEVFVVDNNKQVVFQSFTESRDEFPLFLYEYFE